MLQDLIDKYQVLQIAAREKLMKYLDDLLQKQESNQQTDKITSQGLHTIIDEYRGIGTGVWSADAQEEINQLRENDRI